MEDIQTNIVTYKYFDKSDNHEVAPITDPKLQKMIKEIYILCKDKNTDVVKFINMGTHIEKTYRVNIPLIELILRNGAS